MRWPKTRWTRRRLGLVLTGLVAAAGLLALSLGDRAASWPVVQVITRSNNPFSFSSDGRSLNVTLQGTGGNSFVAIDLATGHEQSIGLNDLFFGNDRSPDGRFLLRHNLRREVRVDDAATGAEIRRLAALASPVFALFAPDGAAVLLFSGPPDHAEEVRTWDLATGSVTSRPLSKPPGLVVGPLRGSSYLWLPSPDGRTLAYFDDARVGIQLWDVATDRPLGGTLRTPTTQAANRFDSALAFTPDSRFFLHGQPNGRVEVWDVARRTLDRTLQVQSPDDYIDCVIPSPDGRTLLIHSWPAIRGPVARGLELVRSAMRRVGARPEEDETVLIDLESGRRLARTPGGQLPKFSPDGQSVAIGHRDRITIHRVPTTDQP